MPTERWRRIEELYHEALARPEAARSEWLAAACGGDHELRREVEALVRYDAADASVLERPALAAACASGARWR
jgi:serine/threonine-protein kinase